MFFRKQSTDVSSKTITSQVNQKHGHALFIPDSLKPSWTSQIWHFYKLTFLVGYNTSLCLLWTFYEIISLLTSNLLLSNYNNEDFKIVIFNVLN